MFCAAKFHLIPLMKPFQRFALTLIAALLATGSAHANITVLHDWHMGESDAGAVGGGYDTNTLDAVGVGSALTNQPVAGAYPLYANNVSDQAAFFAGSSLSEFYSGGQYARGNVISNLTTNFGIELWVYPTAGNGGSVIAYDGNTGGSGWGLYEAGTSCYLLFGGVAFSASSAFLATNAWTELALVCNVGVATLYTNGVPAFTMTATPKSPAGSFLIGADNGGAETFSGGVDEVRVFTFAAGQFSTNDLMVNGPLVVTTNADSGQGSLRAAMAAANPGSTITFATNLSGATITLASTLPIYTSLTIDASALSGGIQLNGNGAVTVFNVAYGTTAVLNSLTITNGYTGGYGGGIWSAGILTLSHCNLFRNNAAQGGGGINCNYGILILDQCNLSENNGGMYGGGIGNGGTLTLNQCTLSGNISIHGGGGIANAYGGTLTLNQCTLSGNDSTIDVNAGGTFDGGGGIYNIATLALNQCTLTGNSCDYRGGGIFNNGGTLTMTNTIVAGNNSSDGADIETRYATVTYGGWNLAQSVTNLNSTITGPAPLNAAPNLAPLGNYGGPTQTVPPLPGSPAIGAGSAAANTFATDQRGYPRTQNGKIDLGAVELPTVSPFTASPTYGAAPMNVQFNFTNTVDSDGSAIVAWNWNFGDGTTGTAQNPIHVYGTAGLFSTSLIVTNSLGLTLAAAGSAVQAGPLLVTNTADSGPGSLRSAIASVVNGGVVNFAANLSGATIMLASTLAINTGLTIDASALPGGLQINGNGAVTVFSVSTLATVVLNSLTITNGYSGGFGGGIYDYSCNDLRLNQCTLAGNYSQSGAGGIYNYIGVLTLNQCTLSRNTSSQGSGGIGNDNSSSGLTLNECTVVGNSGQIGGGINNSGSSTMAMINTIVAGNSGVTGADIYCGDLSVVTFGGSNLVQSLDNEGGGIEGTTPINADPQLAPLGNYGGPTQTMPPLPGSPAIDAASDGDASQFTTDQRGYPRLAGLHVDIGAVEGVYNAAGAGILTGVTRLGNGSFQFGFTNYEDMNFTVFATTNLALSFSLWSNLGPAAATPAGSGQFRFADTGATNSPQRFYRIGSP
jgi:PKD repeat protein